MNREAAAVEDEKEEGMERRDAEGGGRGRPSSSAISFCPAGGPAGVGAAVVVVVVVWADVVAGVLGTSVLSFS